MLANTRRHACGRYTRQRVPGSLRVYPVQDFGAIAQGEHRFCQTDSARCDGLADFTMLWRLRDGRWQVTRHGDILTWTLTYLDAQDRGLPDAQDRLARMTSVEGGGDDRLMVPVTASVP